jgi:hypothetical protein
LDAVNSPSFKSLVKAKDKASLAPLQQDIFTKPRSSEEFFDVATDPLQQVNLITNTRYSGDINKLRKVLKEWQYQTGDTQPAKLTKDWYGREKGETLAEKDKRGEMPGASTGADMINAKGPF